MIIELFRLPSTLSRTLSNSKNEGGIRIFCQKIHLRFNTHSRLVYGFFCLCACHCPLVELLADRAGIFILLVQDLAGVADEQVEVFAILLAMRPACELCNQEPGLQVAVDIRHLCQKVFVFFFVVDFFITLLVILVIFVVNPLGGVGDLYAETLKSP
jgi:hypothetical protein